MFATIIELLPTSDNWIMKPITFSCSDEVPLTSQAILEQILNVQNWPDFRGYGPLPGIREAIIISQPIEIVGTKFQVTSDDGSTHLEEIVAWQPGKSLHTKMFQFSKPLSRLATHFDELWTSDERQGTTLLTRTLHLYSQSVLTRPLLWLISCLLRPATSRHTKQMKDIRTSRKT